MYRNKQRNDKKPLGGLIVTVRNGDVNGALRVLKETSKGRCISRIA